MKKGITVQLFGSAILAMKTPVFFICNNTPPAATHYGALNPTGGTDNTNDMSDPANNLQVEACMFGVSGTLKNLYIWFSTDPGAGGGFVATVMKNGVPTLITVTVPPGVIGNPVLASDLVHTVSFIETDLFSIRYENNALSTNTAYLTGVIEMDPA